MGYASYLMLMAKTQESKFVDNVQGDYENMFLHVDW